MTESPKVSNTNATSNEGKLIDLIQPILEPLGYEVVHVEIQTNRHKTLRLFIDKTGGIGIDDCAAVSRALDEPLEGNAEIEAIFKGPYELEVSSPGVDRPLRLAKDYVRFAGREARLHVFRPLTAAELGDPAYFAKNPKQKNFLGVLRGFQNDSVRLEVSPDGGSVQNKPGKKGVPSKKKGSKTNSEEAGSHGIQISIPLPLISKANLEPTFDFDGDEPAVDFGDGASAH